VVAVVWRSLRRPCVTERTIATLLFALRVLPLTASVIITFVLVVPSFQLLEPRSIDEGMGTMPLALGVCALLLLAAGCFRVITAQAKTSRVVARWLDGAHPLEPQAGADAHLSAMTYCSGGAVPPLTLIGVRKPRVLVSESTVALLNHAELHIALRHELAHLQSRDNLKKLLFRFCPFPGMARLESAWSEAAELAADDAAVASLGDAIDLAAALVKLSRLVPVEAAPVCTVGFVTGSIRARVARLLAWDGAAKTQPVRMRSWYVIPPSLLALFLLLVSYGSALSWTHEVTEWLVR
jgi:Zn-dependent protease with chaperone function